MTARFYALGLTGYPLSHSLSPMLHTAALRAAGFAGEYRLFPVEPDMQKQSKKNNVSRPTSITLVSLVEDLRSGRLDGLNVTIPYKQAVIPYLDQLSPTARAVQAVNTLVIRDGLLYGDNTDVPGFIRDLTRRNLVHPCLREVDQGLCDDHALILGAGGSARAVVYALGKCGWQVTIAARRLVQAKSLIDDLGPVLDGFPQPQCIALEFKELQSLINHTPVQLIVNTTPAGMVSYPIFVIWPDELPLPQDCAIYDLVYNPRETPLMIAAQRSGLPSFNGLGMLIEQAILSFGIWTGVEPPRQQLFDSLRQEVN